MGGGRDRGGLDTAGALVTLSPCHLVTLSPCHGEGGASVGQRIERDHQRFKKIVRGKVKSNLSKYISRGEMIGKKGKDLVSIPLPQIEIPQFRYGQKGSGGAGQGDGNVGDPLSAPQGEGKSGAGNQPGGH